MVHLRAHGRRPGPWHRSGPRPSPLPLKGNLADWQYGWPGRWNSCTGTTTTSRAAPGSATTPEHRSTMRTLAAVLHLHKGTLRVQGEEFGMTNSPFTEIATQDVETLNYHRSPPPAASRGGHPAPARGEAAPRPPPVCSTTPSTPGSPPGRRGTPQANHGDQRAASGPQSVFAHFQKLIRLRHDDEVVREGRFDSSSRITADPAFRTFELRC